MGRVEAIINWKENHESLNIPIPTAACSSFLNITAFAREFGIKEEAATSLERAIALVRIDKNRALDLFTTGEEIVQKGLYVFRAAPDVSVTVHPSEAGTPVEDLAFDNAKT